MLILHMLIVKTSNGKYALCVEINKNKHLCLLNGEELWFDTFDDCDAFLTEMIKKDYLKAAVSEDDEVII